MGKGSPRCAAGSFPRRRYIAGGVSIAALMAWLLHRVANRLLPSAQETVTAVVSWRPTQPLWNRSTSNGDSPYAVPPGEGTAWATQLTQNRHHRKSEESLSNSRLPSEPGTPADDPLPVIVCGPLSLLPCHATPALFRFPCRFVRLEIDKTPGTRGYKGPWTGPHRR